MQNGIHFITGLPRSGSTLLAAILRQNPKLYANISSPTGAISMAALREMSGANEGSVFIDDARRKEVLKGVFTGYYYNIHTSQTIIDTNRLWASKISMLKALYPDARFVCCVRDMPWVYNSIESLIQKNAFMPSKIFAFEAGGTVYDRFEQLRKTNGLIGFAWAALRQACFGPDADRIMLLTYETLTEKPTHAIDEVYKFLGLPEFKHDFENIEFDAVEFDAFLGTPGLHKVDRKVQPQRERTPELPSDLFNRVAQDSFWRNPDSNIKHVKIV